MRAYFWLIFLLLLTTESSSISFLNASCPALSQDTNGFTVFPDFPTTQTYYVSTSGSDSGNNCQTQNSPCQTIATGMSKLRNGFPDKLLLKKGDTWTDEQFGQVAVSGPSSCQPILIGA